MCGGQRPKALSLAARTAWIAGQALPGGMMHSALVTTLRPLMAGHGDGGAIVGVSGAGIGAGADSGHGVFAIASCSSSRWRV